MGTGEAFFDPSQDALTVQIAPQDQLGNANALYGLARSATRIGGPVLGGNLVALAGPAVVVAVDAASYAASVLALSLLTHARAAQRGSRARREGAADAGAWAGHDRGLGGVQIQQVAPVVTAQFAFFNLITWAPWMLLGPVLGHAYLGGAAVWGANMAQAGGRRDRGRTGHARPQARPADGGRDHGSFCHARLDIPMARVGALGHRGRLRLRRGLGAVRTYFGTAMKKQLPQMLARVSSLSTFPANGVG